MIPVVLFLALNAPVSEAVVYQDGARVTRRATVECHDRATVEFAGLPAGADADSLQAEASGARVVALRWARPAPGPPPSPAALLQVQTDLAVARRRLERALGAGTRADGYQRLSETWAEQTLWRSNAAPARWASAVEAVVDEQFAVAHETREASARVRALEAEERSRREAYQRAEALRRSPPLTATVHLACTSATAQVALRHQVSGASWRPVYEARADRDGVELTTYATLRQQTGEPWEGVRLTLSTARPADRATPPALQPLVVWSAQQAEDKRIVARTEEIVRPPTASVEPRTSLIVDLPVPGPSRVPGDGTEVRLLVGRAHHRASLHLRTTPKLAPAAFRVADLVNGGPAPILPGRLEIFRGSTFVGTEVLTEEVAAGARMTVSFGVDDRVKIGRLVLREVERATGLFGGSQRHLFAYRLHLASHLAAAEELEVLDQVPVSQLDDVRVVVEPQTSTGYALEPRDGTMTWRVRLAPGEERALDLAFHVDVPGDYK